MSSGDEFGEFADLFEVTPPLPADRPPATPPRGLSTFFDIETGPEPEPVLEALFEFDPTKVKNYDLLEAEFDESTVRTGNLKDPAKIAAKVAEKREEFNAQKAAAVLAMQGARAEQWAEFCERAPLSPLTGCVLAIGIDAGQVNTHAVCDYQYGEPELLEFFWRYCRQQFETDGRLVGFNSAGFDLPFLVRRSWKLGVDIPHGVIVDRRWHRCFLDLMQVWGCGNYAERVKLDRLAAYFGTPRKSGDGADFHRLYNGTAEDRIAALDYLRRDLVVTRQVAARMGVV